MMTDRERLNKLKNEVKKLNKEIDSIVTHKCGKKYWEIFGELLKEYMHSRIEYSGLNSYETYREYSKLHQKLTSTLGIKTRAITQSEYHSLLNLVENELHFKVREYYKD